MAIFYDDIKLIADLAAADHEIKKLTKAINELATEMGSDYEPDQPLTTVKDLKDLFKRRYSKGF